MRKYRERLEIMQTILEVCECGLGVHSMLTQARNSSRDFQRYMGEMKRLGYAFELPKKRVRLFKVTKKGGEFLKHMREIKKLEEI